MGLRDVKSCAADESGERLRRGGGPRPSGLLDRSALDRQAAARKERERKREKARAEAERHFCLR